MLAFTSSIWIILIVHITLLIDSILGNKCVDTVGWHDNINNSTCSDYVVHGWCVNNMLIEEMKVNSIPSLNFPELNCCGCGKRASVNLPPTARWARDAITVSGSVGGTPGSSLNMLHSPLGIDIDDNNTLYIVDYFNNRIVLVSLNSTTAPIVIVQGSLSSMFTFFGPTGIHVTERSIYVMDALNYRVQKWSRNLSNPVTVAGIFGVNGNSATVTTLSLSSDLFVDSYANTFVSDGLNDRVMMFPWNSTSGTSGVVVAGTDSGGNGTNQLFSPIGIFVEDSKVLYIADYQNHRIQKWIIGGSSGMTVAGTGQCGNSLSQLCFPMSVVVDLNGYMYIADGENNRIMRWTPGADAGECIAACSGFPGVAAYLLDGPRFITFDSSGSLYVSDSLNNRVQKFQILDETIQSTTQSGNTTKSKTNLIKPHIFITLIVIIFVQIIF